MRATKAETLPSTDRFTVTSVTIAYSQDRDPLSRPFLLPVLHKPYAIVDLTLRVDDLTFLGDLASLPAFEGWLAVDDIPHTPSPVPRCPWCGVLRESDAVKCRHCGGPF